MVLSMVLTQVTIGVKVDFLASTLGNDASVEMQKRVETVVHVCIYMFTADELCNSKFTKRLKLCVHKEKLDFGGNWQYRKCYDGESACDSRWMQLLN